MRPLEERWVVWRLADAGLNASQIARTTDLPRSTVRDWIKPKVREPSGRSLCEQCGHVTHDFSALPDAEYAYLLGFYLGDGSISAHRKGVYVLRIVSDSRYVGVLAEVALAITAVMPSNRIWFVQCPGCVVVASASKSWPCLFPQHGPGRKHERRIELTEWQTEIVDRRPQQFIRGLLHSDGCRITNFATTRAGRGRYEYPRYFFTNASDDIRELFCRSLRQVGVAYTQPKPRDISIARRSSVRRLDAFVGPKS